MAHRSPIKGSIKVVPRRRGLGPLARRFIRMAVIMWMVLLCWSAFMGWKIWEYGSADEAKASDCIIVLGAAVKDGEPSPVFQERIRHGADLYQKGLAPWMIFTGGQGNGEWQSESSAGALLAWKLGVPTKDLLLEQNSHTTRENLLEARAIMESRGLKSAIIVSDPLHMRRALRMAGDLGMDAVPSPTPTTCYRSAGPRMLFLAREVFFSHYYVVTGK